MSTLQAMDGSISMGTYAQAAMHARSNADFNIQSASALVEIVNARNECAHIKCFLDSQGAVCLPFLPL